AEGARRRDRDRRDDHVERHLRPEERIAGVEAHALRIEEQAEQTGGQREQRGDEEDDVDARQAPALLQRHLRAAHDQLGDQESAGEDDAQVVKVGEQRFDHAESVSHCRRPGLGVECGGSKGPSEEGGASMTIKGKAYIAGVHEHPARKADTQSLAQLHAESAMGALADAGLSKDDVDGYFCAGDAPGLGPLSMADYMGLKLRHMDSTEPGGSSYGSHVAPPAAP